MSKQYDKECAAKLCVPHDTYHGWVSGKEVLL